MPSLTTHLAPKYEFKASSTFPFLTLHAGQLAWCQRQLAQRQQEKWGPYWAKMSFSLLKGIRTRSKPRQRIMSISSLTPPHTGDFTGKADLYTKVKEAINNNEFLHFKPSPSWVNNKSFWPKPGKDSIRPLYSVLWSLVAAKNWDTLSRRQSDFLY